MSVDTKTNLSPITTPPFKIKEPSPTDVNHTAKTVAMAAQALGRYSSLFLLGGTIQCFGKALATSTTPFIAPLGAVGAALGTGILDLAYVCVLIDAVQMAVAAQLVF